MQKPRVGISRCLLGDAVRYDGGHKRDATVLEAIGPFVEWVPVCPEVEMGMPTPREPITLLPFADGLHMLGVTSREDWTGRMHQFAEARLQALAPLELAGYIFKSGSPSCGLEGPGLFAAAFMRAFPSLPVEDELHLRDAAAREAFLRRLTAPTNHRH